MKKLAFLVSLFFAFTLNAFAAVDINKASKEELNAVKGLGDKKSDAIIEYRKKNGPFKSAEDIEKVKGIGPGIMKQIANDITIDGQPVKVDGAKPAKTDKSAYKTAKDGKAAKEAKPIDTKSVKDTKAESKAEKK